MVLVRTIFARDPLMRLKRKKLGPTVDLKVARRGLADTQAREAEEAREGTPSALGQRKGKKTATSQKRKLTSGASSVSKREKVHSQSLFVFSHIFKHRLSVLYCVYFCR